MLEPNPEQLADFEPVAEQIKTYWKKWGWAKTAGDIVLLFRQMMEEETEVSHGSR